MALTKRKTKFAPDAIVVAWQGGAWDGPDGTPYVVGVGDRLRADHPMVVAVGRAVFVEDGVPKSEWPNPLDDVIAAVESAPALPKPNPRIDPSTPLRDLVVCHMGVLRSSAGSAGEGMIFHKSDPIVRAAPEAFRPLVDTLG